MKHPHIVDEYHLEFLDALRDSGTTNMAGSGPVSAVQLDFDVTKQEAKIICYHWRKTYAARQKENE